MLKKIIKTIALFTFVLFFILLINTGSHPFQLVSEGFSFSGDWLPFQENIKTDRLGKVLHLIQDSYVDSERINFPSMYESATDLIATNIAKVTIDHSNIQKTVIAINGKKKEFNGQPKSMGELKTILQDSIKFISEHTKPEYTVSKIEELAIDGVLETLDPHSNFLSKELFNEMKVGTSGKFGGLGIVIGLREARLTVISPIDNTPASKAGILPGDFITKIEDETTVGMSLSEAVEKMRGDPKTAVTISIERKGWGKSKDFRIIRDIIRVETVESTLLPHNIGYVKVKNFQQDTTKQLKKALSQLTENSPQGLKGLVLDLRYNPGGLLDQAIEVSDLFLQEGTIVTTVGLKNKMRESQDAELKNTQPLYPIVVIVNQGSASASEIVAGALQRNARALVLGQKTFGKGTVQTLYDLPQESAVKLTVAKYLTPGDISIQSIGIIPDVQTVPVIIEDEQITFFYSDEDQGEAELERHFTSADQKTLDLKPEVTAEYLFPKPKEEDLDKEYSFSKLPLEAKQKKLLEDFEVKTSFNILTKTTGYQRNFLVAAAKKEIESGSNTQDLKIAASMKKLGIDWSMPPKQKKPTDCKIPEVSFDVIPTSKDQTVHAGDKIDIQGVMKNNGPCVLYQAKATSKSGSNFFDHREIFFGKIGPNQSVTRKLRLTLPKYQAAGSYEMNFNFEESHGIQPDPKNLMVSVFPNKRPVYSFDYQITDQVDGQSGFIAVGKPERGEKFYLNLKIKNIGEVASKETFVSLKQEGEKTLQLEKGREKLDQVEPNQTKDVKFLMGIPEKFDAPSFELSILVSDPDSLSYIQKKIKINLFQAKIAEPKAVNSTQHFESPAISLNNINQLLKAQSTKALIEGIIKDDVDVQDIYIMVNSKKVLYFAFKDKNKTENFSFPVPLKKGKNDILIVARDNDDLMRTFGLSLYSLGEAVLGTNALRLDINPVIKASHSLGK